MYPKLRVDRLVFCLLLFSGVTLYAQSPSTVAARASKDWAIRLVQAGNATIKTTSQDSLTGVILEVEALHAGITATFDSLKIEGRCASGKILRPLAMFVAGGQDEILKAALKPQTAVVGWTVVIGDKEFAAYTSMLRMAVVLNEGNGVEYAFQNAGKAQFAFIFPKSPEKLVSLTVLGRKVDLKVPEKTIPPVRGTDNASSSPAPIKTHAPNTSTGKTVRIEASASLLTLIKTWDRETWFYTPITKPIGSLQDLKREDVACWGVDCFGRMQAFFNTLGIGGEGVRVMGDGAYNETANKPLLYVAPAKAAPDLKGALQVEFIEKPVSR